MATATAMFVLNPENGVNSLDHFGPAERAARRVAGIEPLKERCQLSNNSRVNMADLVQASGVEPIFASFARLLRQTAIYSADHAVKRLAHPSCSIGKHIRIADGTFRSTLKVRRDVFLEVGEAINNVTTLSTDVSILHSGTKCMKALPGM